MAWEWPQLVGMGRPITFTSEIAETICAKVAEGSSLRAVCRELDISEATVRRWYVTDEQGFSAQYAHARELQIEAMADELLEISDDGQNDWMKIKRGGEEVEVPNNEVLQRSRLRVDTRKWLMSKIVPKKYADKIAVTGGDGSGPILLKWSE
jgi:Transposase